MWYNLFVGGFMIDKLRKCDSIFEIIDTIDNFFKAYNNDNYLPGIYREGSLVSSIGKNADFYAKLIIRPMNLKLTKSWLKSAEEGNFVDGSEDITESDIVYNLITRKRFYHSDLYTLNPNLIEVNDYIYEKIQDNKNVANLVYFNSVYSTYEWPVLIEKNDDEILIFKQALSELINSKINLYSQYKLSVEFEYRDKEHIIKEKEDVFSDKYFIHNTTAEDRTDLVGTIDLEFIMPKINNLNIMTNAISGDLRKINESNWNDDMDAGLIVFNKRCLDFLKKRYVFVEYHMIDLFSQKSILVDILDDKVVFWEGEFNQLPYDIKKQLEIYNVRVKSNSIISKPMYEWQLKGNINYDKFEFPYQKIAKYIFENHFLLAYELKCNLDRPKNKTDFVEKINNILRILNINIEDIKCNELGYITVEKILNTKYLSNKKELSELYDYFCYKIMGVIKND